MKSFRFPWLFYLFFYCELYRLEILFPMFHDFHISCDLWEPCFASCLTSNILAIKYTWKENNCHFCCKLAKSWHFPCKLILKFHDFSMTAHGKPCCVVAVSPFFPSHAHKQTVSLIATSIKHQTHQILKEHCMVYTFQTHEQHLLDLSHFQSWCTKPSLIPYVA